MTDDPALNADYVGHLAPYYDADGVRIYHADCRHMVADLSPDLFVVTDPPYGVSERTDRKNKGRGQLAECNDFPPVYGDDSPFDPSHLLRFNRLVLFGANYYASRLPPSASWVVWDKRDGIPSNDNADVELGWTNLGGPARTYRHAWNGMIKASERDDRRVHPTQKPVSLMSWIVNTRTTPHDVILDPYMGAGSTLIAAKACSRRAIGIEIEERYCEIAARRLAQGVLALSHIPSYGADQ